MNVPMRLQKPLSAQQSRLWSAQPLISFRSSSIPFSLPHFTIVKCGRLNGMDALLINCTVKPNLGYCSVTHLSRRDAVILRRLRIGHTRVTHKYLLSGDSQPLCDECKCSLTVKHILLECCSLLLLSFLYLSLLTSSICYCIWGYYYIFFTTSNLNGTV